ncbi:hypothetical protein [Bradyrhizobium japonicum]|uniref:hypothetical protein n=1 Tax=Bradyrhizobium japonicum TaxID=375 RepID=UPI002011190E|nr:hypothetical protein [Bradyrhizobium japonicum]
MSDVHELLIRGSEKVIGDYRLLLASAKTESERQLYRSRIEREQRLLDQLKAVFRIGSRRERDVLLLVGHVPLSSDGPEAVPPPRSPWRGFAYTSG